MINRAFQTTLPTRATLLSLILIGIFICNEARCEDASTLFNQKCAGCHTIGGGNSVGPDLQPSTKWNASDLSKSIKGMEKNVGPLSSEEVDSLVEFLKGKVAGSQAGSSANPAPGGSAATGAATPTTAPANTGTPASSPDAASTGSGATSPAAATSAPVAVTEPAVAEPASAERGARLFTGSEALSNGGLSCIACHSVDGVGGTMAVDLSQIYKKMPQQALVVACEKTPFKIMKTAYKNHQIEHQEALDLAAYLTSLKEQHEKPTQTPVTLIAFLFAGVAFAVIAIGYRGRKGSAREKLQRRQ